MKEEDKISKERNEDIKRHLNKLDAHLKVITMPDENLHFLKVSYFNISYTVYRRCVYKIGSHYY